MQLLLEDDLPFVTTQIVHRGVVLEIPRVLVDTGSVTTLLSADVVEQAGILPELGDHLRNIYGVGGIEFGLHAQFGQLKGRRQLRSRLRGRCRRHGLCSRHQRHLGHELSSEDWGCDRSTTADAGVRSPEAIRRMTKTPHRSHPPPSPRSVCILSRGRSLSARPYLDLAHLVGAAAAGRDPRRHLRKFDP